MIDVNYINNLHRFECNEICGATHGPCVYFIYQDDEIVYIGSTKNLYRRLCEHKSRKLAGMDFYFSFFSSEDNKGLESILISKIKPLMNVVDNPDALKSVNDKKIQKTISIRPSVYLAGVELAKEKGAKSFSDLVEILILEQSK